MTNAAERLAQRRIAAASRPPVDLVDKIASTVINQGPRPTCVACAVAAAHEGERHLNKFQAAIEPLWWKLFQLGLTSELGTSLQSAGIALPIAGHCDAPLWPYNETLGSNTEQPPEEAGSPPWTVADLIGVPLAHDGVEDAIEDELLAGHPIVLVIDVTEEFLKPELDGFVSTPVIGARSAGYHAVLIAGAWTDPVHGRVFLLRNSWGELWGAEGYCIVGVDFLIAFSVQAAKVVV